MSNATPQLVPGLPEGLAQTSAATSPGPVPDWVSRAWGETSGSLGELQTWWAGLPQGPTYVALAVLGLGTILALFGGRIVKPGVVAMSILWGMVLGTVLAPKALPQGLGGLPGELVGFAAGGVAGFVLGLMVYRATLTITAGIAGAVAGLLIGSLILGRGDASIARARADAAEATAYLQNRRDAASLGVADAVMITLTPGGDEARSPGTGTVPNLARLREEAQRVGEGLGEAVRQRWESLPERDRAVFTLAGGLGALAGALFGLVSPKRAAAGVTAGLGSILVLGSAAWLIAHRPELGTWSARMETLTPMVWLIAWGVVAMFGWSVQVGCRKKAGPKSASTQSASPAPTPTPTPAPAAA